MIERQLLAEQITARAKMTGERLAKEVLAELMSEFRHLAERARPRYGLDGKVIGGNERKFDRWAQRLFECARELARYQSPTFKAVAVVPPQPGIGRQVIDLRAPSDPAELMRVYKRIMDGEVDVLS